MDNHLILHTMESDISGAAGQVGADERLAFTFVRKIAQPGVGFKRPDVSYTFEDRLKDQHM